MNQVRRKRNKTRLMRLTLTQLVPRAAAQMAWDSTGYEEDRSCRLRVPRNQHPLSQGDFSYQPNEALSCLEFLDMVRKNTNVVTGMSQVTLGFIDYLYSTSSIFYIFQVCLLLLFWVLSLLISFSAVTRTDRNICWFIFTL